VAENGMTADTPAAPRALSDQAFLALPLAHRRPVAVRDLKSDERFAGSRTIFADEQGLVSGIATPLLGKEQTLGILCAGNRRQTEFGEQEVELLEAFGNLAAVAIETRRLQHKLESLARLEERERIGMDLHDGVIQSIYAVALHLEDASDRLAPAAADIRQDIERSIEDLNKVIKDIRSYIFDLRPRLSTVEDLSEALRQLVENVRVNTLIPVSVDIEEPLRHVGGEAEALALFHIAQEALNNVVKHSQASQVSVRLGGDNGRVVLEIEDNGRGFRISPEGGGEKHGLRNIRDRARSVGADLKVDSKPGAGTSVRVSLAVKER
jgi:signal transduction histidine kinase